MTQIDADNLSFKMTGKTLAWLMGCTITIVTSICGSTAVIMGKLNAHDQLFINEKETLSDIKSEADGNKTSISQINTNLGAQDQRIDANKNLILQNTNDISSLRDELIKTK